MKTIPAMPETKIEVTEETITISQETGYKTNVISIPIVLMYYFWTAVCNEAELKRPVKEVDDNETYE